MGGRGKGETKRHEKGRRRSKNIPTTTTKPPNNPMHDGNILALYIIHHNLSYFCIQTSVPEKQ
jgi:hypothetical protein